MDDISIEIRDTKYRAKFVSSSFFFSLSLRAFFFSHYLITDARYLERTTHRLECRPSCPSRLLASNFPIGDEARQVAVSLCRLNCFEEAPLLFIHRGTTLPEINENDSRTVSIPNVRTLDNFS